MGGDRAVTVSETLKFEHYDKRVLTSLNPLWDYKQEPWYKPRGLWLSVIGDSDEYTWRDWCEDNDFHLDEVKVRHEVALGEGWDILTLNTARQVRDFTTEYGVEIAPGVDVKYIDWLRVAQEYDGIIFSPYWHTLRFDIDLMWYSTIDVASGCIWNVEAIESIKAVV